MANPQGSITAWAVFSAIGGSITGSIVGGLINYFLQRASRREARKHREEDRLEVKKALAYSMLFKMIRLVSDLEQLRKTITSSIEEATAHGLKNAAPWQMVLPVANLPDEVKFSPDEMALVRSLEDSVFNQIGALDELHNSTVGLFDSYRNQREAIMQKFGASMSGSVGTTSLTKEDAEWLAPRTVILNRLVEAMLQRTGVDATEARNGLKALHNLFLRELGIKSKLEFER